jgi:D-aminoacyl-tRNA deacylase
MRAVVQRVASAAVTIDARTVGAIGHGLLVFVGVERDDGPPDVEYLAGKIGDLRVFDDADDPGPGRPRHMNRSVRDVGGSVLVVSQFTLYGDARKGNRPSYVAAAPPEQAEPLYERFRARLGARGGVFGARMEVALVNDGPVTLLLELA